MIDVYKCWYDIIHVGVAVLHRMLLIIRTMILNLLSYILLNGMNIVVSIFLGHLIVSHNIRLTVCTVILTVEIHSDAECDECTTH